MKKLREFSKTKIGISNNKTSICSDKYIDSSKSIKGTNSVALGSDSSYRVYAKNAKLRKIGQTKWNKL